MSKNSTKVRSTILS